MNEQQFPRVDKEARKELSRDARNLLEDTAFLKAIIALRKRWFDEALSAPDKRTERIVMCKLRALDEIPLQLQSFVNDQVMADKRGH